MRNTSENGEWMSAGERTSGPHDDPNGDRSLAQALLRITPYPEPHSSHHPPLRIAHGASPRLNVLACVAISAICDLAKQVPREGVIEHLQPWLPSPPPPPSPPRASCRARSLLHLASGLLPGPSPVCPRCGWQGLCARRRRRRRSGRSR